MMAKYKRHIIKAILLLLSGCVTAPKVDHARILPTSEMEALTTVKRAKDFSASGRYDLAEKELRVAIRMLPRQSSVYNDLGVVLMSQSRDREASQMFLEAVRLNKDNAVALENYAKVLYRIEDYSSSLKEYKKLLDLLYSKSEEQIQKASGKVYALADFVGILRTLASAYYALGYYDESLCYSKEAMISSPDIYQVGMHSRLLLNFEKINESYQILDSNIAIFKNSVPPGLMLDYAITLFMRNEFEKAGSITDNALKNPQINSEEKKIGYLTSYLILKIQKKDKEAKALAETMITDDEKICSDAYLMKNSYLPATFEDQLKLVRGSICKND